MDAIADACPTQGGAAPMRRITVTISWEVFAALVMMKLFTGKTFNALVAEGIRLAEAKYRDGQA